jgi:two-component system, chemotaxis family, protein-glutamate methylesterase/glutaminase
MAPTKILLVEDSPIAMELLQRLFKSSPDVEVVGTARNGQEALDMLNKVNPTVICTDLHMAPIDGLELTKQVMATSPRPILVISNSVQGDDTKNIFGLLQAGAVDIFPKPTGNEYAHYENIKQKLLAKIKLLSTASVTVKPLASASAMPTMGGINPLSTPTATFPTSATGSLRAIAIGASTGGPQAIHKIITSLPPNLPCPVICAQHISEGFLGGLISWLNEDSRLRSKIAEVGETPMPGMVYFAPEKSHLELDAQGKFSYSNFAAATGTCPSIDTLFKSIARVYGAATAGILLTGMGTDGVEGMKAISGAGGTTIAQDEQTSVVFGMAKAAIATGTVQKVLAIHEVAPFLLTKLAGK